MYVQKLLFKKIYFFSLFSDRKHFLNTSLEWHKEKKYYTVLL